MSNKKNVLESFKSLKKFFDEDTAMSRTEGSDIVDVIEQEYDDLFDEKERALKDFADKNSEHEECVAENRNLENKVDGAIIPETLLDEQKLEIVKRMYSCLTIEQLENVEAQVKKSVSTYANDAERIHS